MIKKPFTISFRYLQQGNFVEVRKVLYYYRLPSATQVRRLANNLFGKRSSMLFSVVPGIHAWDGLVSESSWRLLLPSY